MKNGLTNKDPIERTHAASEPKRWIHAMRALLIVAIVVARIGCGHEAPAVKTVTLTFHVAEILLE